VIHVVAKLYKEISTDHLLGPLAQLNKMTTIETSKGVVDCCSTSCTRHAPGERAFRAGR